jgi:hypothetical protein
LGLEFGDDLGARCADHSVLSPQLGLEIPRKGGRRLSRRQPIGHGRPAPDP